MWICFFPWVLNLARVFYLAWSEKALKKMVGIWDSPVRLGPSGCFTDPFDLTVQVSFSLLLSFYPQTSCTFSLFFFWARPKKLCIYVPLTFVVVLVVVVFATLVPVHWLIIEGSITTISCRRLCELSGKNNNHKNKKKPAERERSQITVRRVLP